MLERLRTRTGLAAALLVAVALIVPAILHATGETFYLRLAARILIYALAASSLNLILGFGGMVSFGHAAFVGVGAYVVGIAFTHASGGGTFLGLPGTEEALILFPLAALAGALSALFIGAISLRTRGVAFIMITLAFAQMAYFLGTGLRTYGGEDGIVMWNRSSVAGGLVPIADHTVFYYLSLAILLGFLVFMARLKEAPLGRVLRGAAQNERRMRALGFPVYRYRLLAFVIAGAAAGLSGALLANATLFVAPAMMAWTRSGDLIIMVVLGGLGTVFGPLVGASALILLEEFLPEWLEHLAPGLGERWKIVLGPLLILAVVAGRRGLWGAISGRRPDG